MSALYEDSHRGLQRQFDTQRLADRIEQRLFRTALTDEDRAFIERLDLFFLATVNSRGEPSCSYKGGDPGFVRVLDSQTLAFPCYDGNGMYLSMGNVAANGRVGMLFIDLTSPKRLRVKVRVPADTPVPTVSGVWTAANWAERETYDFYGIQFEGHPDLRRILMPEDWEGHPMRRDYPVQIKQPVKTYAPLQVSEEEFVANIQEARNRAQND